MDCKWEVGSGKGIFSSYSLLPTPYFFMINKFPSEKIPSGRRLKRLSIQPYLLSCAQNFDRGKLENV